MDTINNEVLIRLVRERQCLWDVSLEEYKNKNFKKDVWKDICQQLFEYFEDLNELEKSETCRCVQLRWKNLRDQFSRELRSSASTSLGSGVKKKREYIYFKNLEFLRKVYGSKPIVSNMPEADIETRPSQKKPSSSKRLVGQKRNSKFDEELLSHLTQTSPYSESVHVNFIKSLLPTLETFSADETLEFQGEVLNVVRSIKRQRLVHYVPTPDILYGNNQTTEKDTLTPILSPSVSLHSDGSSIVDI